MHRGYQLWAKHVNAKGGLLGRPVELLIYDDKSDPQTSADLYQQLINLDKVDLVLGTCVSPIGIVASTVTEKLHYPMIPYGNADEIWRRGYKYVFGILPPGRKELEGALALAKQLGLKRVALINENTVWARTVAGGVIEGAPGIGLELVFHEEYTKGTEDFRPLLAKVKDLQPEVLLTAAYLEENILIVRQMQQLDFLPRLYASAYAASLDGFGDALGQDAEYVLSNSDWEPQHSLRLPGMPPFIEDFEKEYGRLPSSPAAGAYGIGQVLEAAVTKAASLDREKIRDALANLDMVSVYGRYKVDAEGTAIGHEVLMIQWQKGKKQIVWPEAYATAKLIFPIPAWNARNITQPTKP
jgi:branched-chain amino acid transport system substrate-binding protein